MKLLITGGRGQLGRCLGDLLLESLDIHAQIIDIEDLDLTEFDAVGNYLIQNPCDIIINCAAYTAVDKAEEEKEKAATINVEALKNLAEHATRTGTKIIHISTDYVFDGKSEKPYLETDSTFPVTTYGKTKLEGERILKSVLPEAIIIRTAWLYSEYGKNFFLTMKSKAKAGEEVKVVNDQRGTPTYAGDLAKAILEIVKSKNWIPGVYHFTNAGETTWYEFAREIYSLSGANPELVVPIDSSMFNCLATRPKYSVLDKFKIQNTYKIDLSHWKASLKALIKKIDNGN